MILDPAQLSNQERYKLLIGAVVPRPIAWVSSVDAQGRLNLAPFSFFTVVATEPMTILFCPQTPAGAGAKKDTLHNIEEAPEFVVNFTNEETAAAMNRSSTILPRGESEFVWAGVTPIASDRVAAPRVAEAPIAFECRLQRIVSVGEGPGGGAAVFGEVLCVHVRDDLFEQGRILLDRYRPIGRLAGNEYCRVTDLFEMARPAPPLPE